MDRARPADVLDAWFQAVPPTRSAAWIDPRDEVVTGLAIRFRGLVDDAVGHRLDRWHRKHGGAVALVLLLCVFPRCLWLDGPRALVGDQHAQALALKALAGGRFHRLPPEHQALLLLPLTYAEDPDFQERAVEGYARIAAGPGGLYGPLLERALERQEVIQRFGRFPHRNDWSGRVPTSSEAAWLTMDAPAWALRASGSPPSPAGPKTP